MENKDKKNAVKSIKKDSKKTNNKNLKTNKKEKPNKKQTEKKVEEIKVENLYFGHNENENIFDCFLTNKMFAHRGYWDKQSPENSLSAFEKAIEKGYGIELDVSPIADGTPVVFHDSKLSRMTGKDGYIQNLTKEEFEEIKLLGTDEKIPTLEDVLKLVKGKVPLLIEIKSQEKIGELEKNTYELLKNYKGEYAIQSFNPYTLKWFLENAPKIWRGQLSSYFKGEKLGVIKKSILKRLKLRKMSQFDFVNYNISDLPNRYTKKLDVPLLTWTIRSQEDYFKAVQFADNVVFEGFEPKI